MGPRIWLQRTATLAHYPLQTVHLEGTITPSVFISYRREDCPGHAGRLFDHLRARFGGASVFMDVTDIEAGVDFVDVLQRAVGSCDVLLAVMGREWLTCTDRNGRRRLDDPHDFIRLEVGIALTRNVRVIPVLVEGAVMPTASELPSDLEGLTRRQAVELRDGRWNADVESLAGVLDRVLGSRTAGNESTGTVDGTRLCGGSPRQHVVAALVAVVMLVRPRRLDAICSLWFSLGRAPQPVRRSATLSRQNRHALHLRDLKPGRIRRRLPNSRLGRQRRGAAACGNDRRRHAPSTNASRDQRLFCRDATCAMTSRREARVSR